jgi:hypothetical protein
MPDRKLKLNSLDRYSKDSPELVLEEYGSCEVPAGCGGVVLRWRNPDEGIPLPVGIYTAGERDVTLDEQPLVSGRPMVSFGEHVLAITVSGFDPACIVLMFAAIYDEADLAGVRLSHPTGQAARILSAADGTWKYTAEPPDEEWAGLAYDDTGWLPMVARETARPPRDPQRDLDRWTLQRLSKKGAAGLGVRSHAPKVWIRKRFVVARSGRDAE